MILAFKPQFKGKILSGQKIHTIRLDPKRRWRKGMIIHYATGVRTKEYNEFKKCECVSCQAVFMTYAHSDLIQISVGGKELTYHSERLQLAKNDGFDTWDEFFDWFYPVIQKNHEKCFSGRIIHWTDFKY